VRVSAAYRGYSSSANLGSGYDVLAVAHTAFYDEVLIKARVPGSGNVSVKYVGKYAPLVRPLNGCCVVGKVVSVLREVSGIAFDAEIVVRKGVPPGRGLGSSGVSAALVAYALNDALELGLKREELLRIAGEGEALVAGKPHYDNVAATLIGGLVIVGQDGSSLRVWRVPVNRDLAFVIAVPHVPVPKFKTKVMRSVIPATLPLNEVTKTSSRLAALVTGLILGNSDMIRHGMIDDGAVKARVKYIPCYSVARDAALRAGAYGFAISGAGPSTVAITSKLNVAKVAEAVKAAYSKCGVRATVLTANAAEGPIRLFIARNS